MAHAITRGAESFLRSASATPPSSDSGAPGEGIANPGVDGLLSQHAVEPVVVRRRRFTIEKDRVLRERERLQ